MHILGYYSCDLFPHLCPVWLVNLNDRGGLWKVNTEMQGIFIECEKYFVLELVHFKHRLTVLL